MKKCEKIARIRELVAEFNKHARTPFIVPESIDKAPAKLITDTLKWMESLETTKQLFYIYSLSSEEVWQRTFMQDNTDLREVQLLIQARKAFNKEVPVKKRPLIFRKGKLDALIKKANREATSKTGRTSGGSDSSAESNSPETV